jgi:hypothetical protein
MMRGETKNRGAVSMAIVSMTTATSAGAGEVPVAAGGRPIRGGGNPLPDVFPRRIAPAAYANVKQVLDSGMSTNMISQFEKALAAATGTT